MIKLYIYISDDKLFIKTDNSLLDLINLAIKYNYGKGKIYQFDQNLHFDPIKVGYPKDNE